MATSQQASKRTASRKTRDEPAPTAAQAREACAQSRAAFRKMIVRIGWQEALRWASTSAGAPSRCPRRACQTTGRCHLSIRRPDAPCGGGLAVDAVDRADDMIGFACVIGERLRDAFILALPAVVEGIAALGPELKAAKAMLEARSGKAL